MWIFNHYAKTPETPAGIRHFALALAATRHGAHVTVFAAGFSHLQSREQKVHGISLVRVQIVDGITFVWVRTFPYRGNTWRRVVNMASYVVVAGLAQFGRPRPDVVVGTTVHPLAALLAWAVATVRDVPFIFEVQDLWPQTLVDLGALRADSPAARLLYAIEAFLVRRAATVITLLPGMRRYLDERALPSQHVRYLPNGVDLAGFDAAAARRDRDATDPLLVELAARRRRGELIFAYVGTHGLVYRLDVVLRALAIANGVVERPISLVLVGDGPEKPALQRLASELELPNVLFAPPVPKDFVPAILSSVDVGVVHATWTPVYRYGISFNKVFDYMAARLPIAFACSASNDLVARVGAGYSVRPDAPEALAEAFRRLASLTAAERRAMGEAGRAAVEREHDLLRIGDEFARIVASPDATHEDDGEAGSMPGTHGGSAGNATGSP